VFCAALFKIVKRWKQPKYSSAAEWIKKLWHICPTEYCWAIGKRWNSVIYGNMDRAGVTVLKETAKHNTTSTIWSH
jgi:hypothetical protein